MNNLNKQSFVLDAQATRKREYRTARRLSMLGAYNRELQRQIKEHLWETYNVSLPPFKKTYSEEVKEIFDFDAYGSELHDQLNELCKFYYALGDNKVFLAQITDQQGFQQVNSRLGQYYSKHRLDPIWNSSKSKKFRLRMARFLEEEKWFEQYQPTHLVLTVPHKHGKWRGKEIYIHELIKAFRDLRDQRWWKKHIYGGLYCLEVKKNKVNGYHIHLHVLCFQHPNVSVNETRGKIKDSWKRIVDNETAYDGIHYSSLYFFERDAQGRRIPEENCYVMLSDTDPELQHDQFGNPVDPLEVDMKSFKKRFIRVGDSVDDWIKGVMECLKYHFKPGVLEKSDGSFDVPLVTEILNATKGDRFMSKFGKLHNHPGLSLNGKGQSEKEEDDDIDQECLGSAREAELALVNPFTGEICRPEEYRIIMVRPEDMLVSISAFGGPTIRLKSRSPVAFFHEGTTVTDAFRVYCSRKGGERMMWTTTDQLALQPFGPKPERKAPRPLLIKQKETITNSEEECPF